jgi:hypothetical protein
VHAIARDWRTAPLSEVDAALCSFAEKLTESPMRWASSRRRSSRIGVIWCETVYSRHDMAGYSKRSLVEKLGIKPGANLIILNAPEGYDKTLGALPAGVSVAPTLGGSLAFIQFFTREREALESAFPALKQALAQGGQLWISWPKGSSKVPTDLNENIVREIGLQNGLVDVKVIAVDEVWSGLKFVYRLKDRQ